MSKLDPILRPRSIAVVGASRAENTIGHQVVSNLVLRGYTGAVYPINPNAAAIHSIPAYESIGAVPTPPDLAVIVVPKEHVAEVAASHTGRYLQQILASNKLLQTVD